MRIAMVSHTNAPWTRPCADYFLTRGYEVLVISFHPQALDGITCHYVGGAGGFERTHGKWLYVSRALRVRRLLRDFRPNVVYAPYLVSNGLCAALAGCRPLVVAARGSDGLDRLAALHFPRAIGAALIRWICRQACLVQAVGNDGADQLIRLGVPASKVFVLPLGIDTVRFGRRPGARSCGIPHIVCLRRHEPLYRNDIVIRALAMLRRRGVAFRATFAGTGSLLARNGALAEQLQLAGSARFTGELSAEDVARLLQESDIYVSATPSDGASSSLLEAMATGVYPIVADIPANRQWIGGAENGLLFDPTSPAALADMLVRALAQPEARVAAAEHNRDLVIAQAERRNTMPSLARRLTEAASACPTDRSHRPAPTLSR